MAHIFAFSKMHILDTPERRKMLPPAQTLQKLGLRKNMVMVDVGCGSGYFSFPAVSIVGLRGFVWGVDIEQKFVAYCTEKAKKDEVLNSTFLKGTGATLPLENGIADAILVALVFHEVRKENREKYLKEMARVLRPNGAIFIIEWKKEETAMGPPLAERLHKNEIRTVAERAGLRVTDIYDISARHYAVILEKA